MNAIQPKNISLVKQALPQANLRVDNELNTIKATVKSMNSADIMALAELDDTMNMDIKRSGTGVTVIFTIK